MKKKLDKAKQSATRLLVKLQPHSRSANAPDPNSDTILPASTPSRHEYADPQTPHTVAATTGSVVHEFLAAARDGSDLCLPLKAALVGAVKIFEICQACADFSSR